jgi:L-fuculose-phosphate aldolase
MESFDSSSVEILKEKICEIGRRLYARGYAAGNDGNISFRIDDSLVLCTPTMQSKGLIAPEDLVVVDMDGQHVSGTKRRSSEVMLHLAIYQNRDDIRAVVHCHPPHATAFAFTHRELPRWISPEVEMFLGDVAITPYETPGTKAFAQSVVPYLEKANALILSNHGTVSYARELEHAYWWTEVLDAYCRTLILAQSLGPLQTLPPSKQQEILEARAAWGFLK